MDVFSVNTFNFQPTTMELIVFPPDPLVLKCFTVYKVVWVKDVMMIHLHVSTIIRLPSCAGCCPHTPKLCKWNSAVEYTTLFLHVWVRSLICIQLGQLSIRRDSVSFGSLTSRPVVSNKEIHFLRQCLYSLSLCCMSGQLRLRNHMEQMDSLIVL